MIIFIADIHLKLGQKNVPKDWAINRYKKFFKQIKDLEDAANLLIIGGDLFDRVPTMEELELYFDWISNIGIKTLITTGNHEATKKGHSFLSQLKLVSNRLNPVIHIIDKDYVDEEIGFSIMPYESLHKPNSIENFNTKYPLFTHVRGEIPPHVTPEVDLDRFNNFPVVFAGDLHSHSNCQRNIVYPGSPMTTTFHRSKVSTGYILIDEKTWNWSWKELQLPQLLRKTVSSTDDMIPGVDDHVIYELEGDIGDLAQVANTELLDKKVIKRNTETSLVLNKSMTIGEELFEYLSYILEISEDKIPDIIGLFNDYTKNIEMG